MTVNAKMWGPNPETSQTELLKQFNTLSKVKSAVQVGKTVCLKVLSGVVNHIAPAGRNQIILSCQLR
jgi:hypothetical protein